jgi:hypothetical protein
MKNIFIVCFLFIASSLFGQVVNDLKGSDLLEKSIQFHDPKGNWDKLHQKFYFHAKEPQDTAIYEQMFLDNRFSFFGHSSKADGKLIEKGIIDTFYFSRIDGDTAMTPELRKKYRLSKRAITAARNSYVFLYGLPMKLKDKGVKVYDEVKMDTINKKTYYVVKADFEKGVGNDTWYLYLNPTNYAMEAYRFYHNRKPNDGEYIICQDMITVQEVKIPRIRTWYSNATGEYIATDIIEKSEKFAWKKKNATKLK